MQITVNDELVENLRKFPNPEAFVNSLLKEKISRHEIIQKKLEEAVRNLMDDYLNDSELTAFSDLDGEDFYAQR